MRFPVRARRLTAIAAVLAVTGGCGLLPGAGGDGAGQGGADGGASGGAGGEGAEAITSRPLTDHPDDSEARISLTRIDGESMLATMELEATGEEEVSIWGEAYYRLSRNEDDNHSFSGIGWIDAESNALQLPYMREDGTCLCTETERTSEQDVDPGETSTFAAVLPAPGPDVDRVSLITTMTSPFIDVPIEDGEADPASHGIPHPDEDAQAEPFPLPFGGVSAAADGSEETLTGPSSTDINLSTDVLFAVDESELTGEASAILEEAAGRIDASGATEVRIEGHADDTGTDEINDPLSEDRAESVRDELDRLIDRDVSFDTEGFGSREPLVEGDGEEARKRNRRVTVVLPTDSMTDPGSAAPGAEAGGSGAGEEESGDGGGGGTGKPATEYSVRLNEEVINDVVDYTLSPTALRRIDGGYAILTYTVTNNGDEDENPWGALKAEEDEATGMAAEGIALVDPADGRRYRTSLVYEPDEEDGEEIAKCACTNLNQVDHIDPGGDREYYAVVQLPSGADPVDIEAGIFPVMEGVAFD